jgi:hypothetical protein
MHIVLGKKASNSTHHGLRHRTAQMKFFGSGRSPKRQGRFLGFGRR